MLAALLAIGCVTAEDHVDQISQRGDSTMTVNSDAGSFDAGPSCPTNTAVTVPCNGDPWWATCKTTIYPNPPACASIDKTTQAWRDCIAPPASGCTISNGTGPVTVCVASCQ